MAHVKLRRRRRKAGRLINLVVAQLTLATAIAVCDALDLDRPGLVRIDAAHLLVATCVLAMTAARLFEMP